MLVAGAVHIMVLTMAGGINHLMDTEGVIGAGIEGITEINEIDPNFQAEAGFSAMNIR
jgi:hypothetical protein